MRPTVTCTISTKDRLFTSLPMTISAVATQTVKPDKFIILNDGEEDFNPYEDPTYSKIVGLLNSVNMSWIFAYGGKRGQVYNHQTVLQNSDTDLIWRLDDDNIPESNVLEKLLRHFDNPNVAAAGSCVPFVGKPIKKSWPLAINNPIEQILSGYNAQWYRPGTYHPVQVDHLYSTFLYRSDIGKIVGGYPTTLSRVGFREETIFTYSMKAAGYQLIYDPEPITWHLSIPSGGIRPYQNQLDYKHDEVVFFKFLKDHGIVPKEFKYILVDGGIGDHYAFLSAYPDIIVRHMDKNIIIFCCYPEVLNEIPNVSLISIQDAYTAEINIDQMNIYNWMRNHQWKDSMVKAYVKLYS